MAERHVCRGLPAEVRLKAVTRDGRLPFVFEASGSETHFTNGYDPNPRARRVFAFPQPPRLARTLRDATADPERPTWRGKVAAMPEVDIKMLRPAQITASSGIERSLAEQHFDRSLGADGHRGGQDVRGRDHGLPAVEAWRVQSGPVPGGPQQPGRSDVGGVPELPHPPARCRSRSIASRNKERAFVVMRTTLVPFQPRDTHVPRGRRASGHQHTLFATSFNDKQPQLMTAVQWSKSRISWRRHGFHNQPQLATAQ
jgi:hypothetical protein